MAVVYQHIRKDTNEVFYVGIGKLEKRAYSKDGRNPHWKNIVNKAGYYVEIIYSDLQWDLACNMEQYLIESYGRVDLSTGCLVNMTNGGESIIGHIITKEHKEKISKSLIGNKRTLGHNHSESARKKISEAMKGCKNPMYGKKHSQIVLDKLSKIHNGKKLSDSHVKIIIQNNSKQVLDKSNGVIYESAKKCYNSNKETLGNYAYFRAKLCGLYKNNTNFEYIKNEK
jgi:hypothetical protein